MKFLLILFFGLTLPTLTAADWGNVLFLGDSITEASSTIAPSAGNGDRSWRYEFWKLAVDAGDSLGFVGSRTSNHGGPSPYPPHSGLTFPNRHEAIWGTTTTERLNTLDAGPHWVDLNRDGSNLVADTAFILMGCNDFASTTPTQTVLDGVVTRITSIVDRLQAANPNVRVVVLGIFPRFVTDTDADGFKDSADGRNDDYQLINATLANLPTSKSTGSSKVTFLNLHNTIQPQWLYDGIHPNLAGEVAIGAQVYAHLTEFSGPVALVNSLFSNSAHGTDPSGWTTTDPASGLYVWNDGQGGLPDSSLAFMDPAGALIIEQNLSVNNHGLFAENFGSWTATFEYGWRNNSNANGGTPGGGAAEFTVSLVDTTTNTVLTSAVQALPLTTPTVFNTYTQLGVANLALDYDATLPALLGHQLAIRIERTDANDGLGTGKWRSTAFIDNVTLSPRLDLPPTVTTGPLSIAVSEFFSHSFSIEVSGSEPLTFQWQKDGINLPGETAASLSLTNLTPSDAADYRVVISNAFGSVTSSVATLTVDLYNRDLAPASALIARILPNHASRFLVEFIPPEDGFDVFEIDNLGDRIVLRGNSGVSVASALKRYLKDYCHCHLSRNGDQLALPSPLPRVDSILRVVSPHQLRYFYNATTLGYTSAWWQWQDWERELDLLALDGINLAQVTAGNEEVLRRTLRDHFGYTDAEVRAWLCHPSHLPWMLLGNMHSFGGPLPAALIDGRLTLGQQIVQRMQELGIEPVLPGCYGMVPQDFKTRFPATDIRTQGFWVAGYERPDLVNPTDPIFATFSQHYYQTQALLFPGVRYFAADPFHEGGSTAGIDLATAGQALVDGMSYAHPRSIWVAQAWSGNPRQGMLDGIDKSRALVLDLNCTNNETWRSRNAFNGTPWLWCAIQNFGGNTGMVAKLDALATRPSAAYADANKGEMSGIGAVPEATDTIPAAYELLFEQGWQSDAIDLQDWIPSYLLRRYGKSSPGLELAWQHLLETNMDLAGNIEEPHNSIVTARPGLSTNLLARRYSTTGIPYDASRLAPAWGLMLDSAPVCPSDPFLFDLADVARQVLCDLATHHQRALAAAYASSDSAAVHLHGDRILEIISDLDTLCATRPEWLLGTWLNDARGWGSTTTESDLCEWNARVLITTWSNASSDLNDYANREWSGLLSGFYLPRWQQFLTALYAAVDNSQTFNETSVRTQIANWEIAWANGTESYPTTPTGDTLTIAQTLWAKYQNDAVSDFNSYLITHPVGTTWTPAICATQPVVWTRDVIAEITSPGTWQVSLQYTSGANALQIHEVSLSDGTNIVERDTHFGWTGITTYDNHYYLTLDTLPTNLTLRIVASTAGGTTSNGTITITPVTTQTLAGSWTASDLSTTPRIFSEDVSSEVLTPGDYRITFQHSAGSVPVAVDRVWLEQDSMTIASEVRDERLSTTAPLQSYHLRVPGLTADPVFLRFAANCTATPDATGSYLIEKIADLPAPLPNPVCWPEFAQINGLDPAQPQIDTDGDGVSDLMEFYLDSDPLASNALCALSLDGSNPLILQAVSAPLRTGVNATLQTSTDLSIWASYEPTFLNEDSAGSRFYQLQPNDELRFFRLLLETTP